MFLTIFLSVFRTGSPSKALWLHYGWTGISRMGFRRRHKRLRSSLIGSLGALASDAGPSRSVLQSCQNEMLANNGETSGICVHI